MNHPLVLPLVVATALASCTRRVETLPPRGALEPQTVHLLERMHEQETSAYTETRKDVEVDTRSGEREPRVVATKTTDLLMFGSARGRLFGDREATEGFWVDNFVLLEFLDENDEVLRRAVVGYADPVLVNDQQLDTVGPRAFKFEAGQIDISPHFPRPPFKIRATALDTGGVGKVSDIWLRIEPGAATDDDWR